jgi:hypothetical protein
MLGRVERAVGQGTAQRLIDDQNTGYFVGNCNDHTQQIDDGLRLFSRHILEARCRASHKDLTHYMLFVSIINMLELSI